MSDNGSFLDKMKQWLGSGENVEDEKPDEPQPPMTIPEVKIDYGSRDRPSSATIGDPTQSSREVSGVDLVYLRQKMSNYLDNEALATVGYEVDVDVSALSGGKGRKVLQLIGVCEQNGRLRDLLTACQEHNSDIDWQPREQ